MYYMARVTGMNGHGNFEDVNNELDDSQNVYEFEDSREARGPDARG